jgi:hypothetical protein
MDSRRNTIRALTIVNLLLAAGCFVPQFLQAQGVNEPAFVLRTGGNVPLVSATQSVFVPGNITAPELLISIGFATAESWTPGSFLDSVTLTLRDQVSLNTAIYATIDGGGTLWAPSSGGLTIDPDSIIRSTIPFPSLTPELPFKWAYVLRLPVPEQMLGRSLDLHLDLFDNQNGSQSLAWMSGVVVIPEPSGAVIFGCGVLALFLFTCRHKMGF